MIVELQVFTYRLGLKPMGNAGETVVLVHGLYMHGSLMMLLARRLRRAGYRPLVFSYPSVRRTLLDNAYALAGLVQTLDAAKLHFVAHSLGGIVVWYLFSRFPEQAPGRVVSLGTPYQGSFTARRLCSRGFRFILGRSIEQGLLEDLPYWPARQELGSVAGTLNVGLGRLIATVPGPGDGTVSVAETYLAGMTDHICLPVSHAGMLFAPAVVDQVCAFLAEGKFRHAG